MKNTLSIIIYTFIFCFCLCKPSYAKEDDLTYGYRYFSLGTGPIIFIPNVGLGMRGRSLQHGWDTSVTFATIGYAHQIGGHFVGHYYFIPEQNSPYLGMGVLGSSIFTNEREGGLTISPDFVFGKELKRGSYYNHFIEMHIAIPTFLVSARESSPLYFPLIYVKYGLSF